jgi:predicted small lipoprotein YifL
MKILCLWVLVGLAATIGGCGQKGPLVLPDAEHPHKKVKFPVSPKSPASAAPAASADHPAAEPAAEPAAPPEAGADAAPIASPTPPQHSP